MKTGTKILIGLGVGLALGGIAYRAAINDLQFSIDGFQAAADGSGLQVRIKVINPARFFGFPVPRMLVNAFDSTGSFIGTIYNEQLQYIPANQASFIYGSINPNYGNLVSLIVSTIQSGHLPTGMVFHGFIELGSIEIPFDTSTSLQ